MKKLFLFSLICLASVATRAQGSGHIQRVPTMRALKSPTHWHSDSVFMRLYLSKDSFRLDSFSS